MHVRDWAGCKVLVTGASGYIGARLISGLYERGAEVRALVRGRGVVMVRSDTAILHGDLLDPSSLKDVSRHIDTVFHLAGYAHADDASSGAEELHWRISVDGTRALLKDAIQHGVQRFVFLSSVKAMGEGGDEILDEAATPTPTSPYGQAKLAAESLVLESCLDARVHACVLRLPLVYGRENKGNLSRMLSAVAKGRFPPLPETRNRRSMVHVDDVVAALLLSVQPKANGQRYIVTDGVEYSTRQIYDWMREALGFPPSRWAIPLSLLDAAAKGADLLEAIVRKRLPFNSDRLSKLLGSARYSSSKIMSDLAFEPKRTLRESIPEMIAALGIET